MTHKDYQGDAHASRRALADTITTGQLIVRVYTDMARYDPGSTITIYADLNNRTGNTWSGLLTLTVNHLEHLLYNASQAVSLPTEQAQTVSFTWSVPGGDFQGYYVSVAADPGEGATAGDYYGTGVDVSSTAKVFPRYGYLCDFKPDETAAESQAKIDHMVQQYHINVFQFYDWMWRHENLIQYRDGSPCSNWTDVMDRPISWSTIQNRLAAVHARGGIAMAYAMIYAARESYQQLNNIDPSWGIYHDAHHAYQYNVDFHNGRYLWLFNPSNRYWQDYVVAQFKDAINHGFDGIQIDQMGQREGVYDFRGQPVNLPVTFPQALQEIKSELTANNPSRDVITFNIVDGCVGGWAANEIASYSPTDFDFSELWWKIPNYADIRNFTEFVRQRSGGKPLVYAGYMNYREELGPHYDAEEANFAQGIAIGASIPGFTGTGYLTGFNAPGQSISWTVDIAESGNYAYVFRYTNHSNSSATRNLYVDGELVDTVTFQPQWDGNWYTDAWQWSRVDKVGRHTISLVFDAGNSGGIALNINHLTLGTFDDHSVRLASAAFAASGAYHIELGEGDHMLAHEYYPNRSKCMRNSLKQAMADHYSFITAYENLIYGKEVNPTSDQGAQWAIPTTGQATSGNGSANAIWQIVKHTAEYDILHLINLMGIHKTEWRYSQPQPEFQTNVCIKFYLGQGESATGVYVASPDTNHGATQQLDFVTGWDTSGTYIQFTVPHLYYWDMVYIRRNWSTPANNRYEAEKAILTNVSTANSGAGFTGASYVTGWDTVNQGISFVINTPADDFYTLRFRYSQSTGAPASRTVFVDGQRAGQLVMRSLYNGTWNTVDQVLHLTPGFHQVVVWYTSDDAGSIKLDSLQVLKQVNPTHTSATSLYLNNWNDLVAIWMTSHLTQKDTGTHGPRLSELRFKGNWAQNQIIDYCGFFRNETANVKYDQTHEFDTEAYFDADGILTNNYLTYNGAGLPVAITRSYAMVPGQEFLVVKYTLTNLTGHDIIFNLLEQVHLNNVQGDYQPPPSHTAWYDSSRNAIFADMTASGQFYLGFGAVQPMDSYQVGSDTNSNVADNGASPWYQFDSTGTLDGNSNLTAPDLDLAFQKRFSIPGGGTASAYFYITVQGTQAAVQNAADTARSQSGSHWFSQTAAAYTDWLKSGKLANFSDPNMNQTFKVDLVTIKQAQHPDLGCWPATTNPAAYSYKVWARDSAMTCIGLDAAGHTTEAAKFWRWMATRQGYAGAPAGTWKTCFIYWDGSYSPFVEPEYDAVGMFLIGVFRHYQYTGDAAFLNDLWPYVTASADWIRNNIGSNHFGPPDCSIFEETFEYYTYTQALYVQGLAAAMAMAKVKGDMGRYDSYNLAASTIRSQLQISLEWNPVGNYNDSNRYYNRALSVSNYPTTLVDSSTNITAMMGMIDTASTRVRDHLIMVMARNTKDTWALSRYPGDNFYYTDWFSPGGNEALAASPAWPQMTMYLSMIEFHRGDTTNALRRLQWVASRTGRGFMPQGECVSFVSQQPCVSTMTQPISAASYLMGALTYLGQWDSRINPAQYNAGASKTIVVTPGTSGDWTQWVEVPYYRGNRPSTSGRQITEISRVYLSNDARHLYLRIDNAAGMLPHDNQEPKFGVLIYSEDFSHAPGIPSLPIGMYGGTLDRPMHYLLARWSDSACFSCFKVADGAWVWGHDVSGVIPPQWDATKGRIEVVIPIAQLSSSGSVSVGAWANLNIVLAYHDCVADKWHDDCLIPIRYNITTGQPWLFGDLEK